MATEEVEVNMAEQFASLNNLLFRPSEKFAPPNFEPGEEILELMAEEWKVLVIGAGGLGCELLKDLALSGFRNIDVIDLDTIELSNLNRQFLFREKDIGEAKSSTAAQFVMDRVPGVNITAHHQPIQEFGSDFYQDFDVVIAGLDNVAARRWINAKLYSMVEYDEDGNPNIDTIIPLIDGGTEGFKGHVRLFVPGISSCFECSLGALPPQTGYALCTLQGKPRKPEHCVAYAHKLLWPKLKFINGLEDGDWELARTKSEAEPGVTFDSDDTIHMTWMYQQALKRAEEYNIEGVTYNMTMQVTKNIIPAIASTNAIIAAQCVTEALKVLTWCSFNLDNWWMYMGQNGLYTQTTQFEKNKQCMVCGDPIPVKLDKSTTFGIFRQWLIAKQNLKNPSISDGSGKQLYHTSKVMKSTWANLDKTIEEVLGGEVEAVALNVTDKASLGTMVAKFLYSHQDDATWVPPEED